jgi:hypothetical protein
MVTLKRDGRALPYSVSSSAADSPKEQKVNDDESCDYATGAEGEHVANVMSGDTLACFGLEFRRSFRAPASGSSLAEITRQLRVCSQISTLVLPRIKLNAIAVRTFLHAPQRNFQATQGNQYSSQQKRMRRVSLPLLRASVLFRIRFIGWRSRSAFGNARWCCSEIVRSGMSRTYVLHCLLPSI